MTGITPHVWSLDRWKEIVRILRLSAPGCGDRRAPAEAANGGVKVFANGGNAVNTTLGCALVQGGIDPPITHKALQ